MPIMRLEPKMGLNRRMAGARIASSLDRGRKDNGLRISDGPSRTTTRSAAWAAHPTHAAVNQRRGNQRLQTRPGELLVATEPSLGWEPCLQRSCLYRCPAASSSDLFIQEAPIASDGAGGESHAVTGAVADDIGSVPSAGRSV